MNWKKRTQEEIDYSVDKLKDYTGGYEFFPWLWHMRKMYLVGLLGNLILGWYGGISSMDPNNENPQWMGYCIIGFFGVFAPILIGYMLRRDYKMSKKGQSS
jgi:hypothetical protein